MIRKLTAKFVFESGGDGSMTYSSISRMFPISRQMVVKISRGKAWAMPEIRGVITKIKRRARLRYRHRAITRKRNCAGG